MTTPPSVAAYNIGRFTLDLRRGCLREGEREVRLRRKSLDTLAYLVANAGRLVTKDELMAAVWPTVVVTEDSLVQCVREIRRAIEDADHSWLKTVPGRGYIFDMPVPMAIVTDPTEKDAEPRPLPARAHQGAWPFRLAVAVGAALVISVAIVSWRAVAPSRPSVTLAAVEESTRTAPRLSIVVLPFANLSEDAGQEYLADALVEDITTELSHWRGAFVISRGSAFTYRGKASDPKVVGRELGVRYVVLGSLRRAGDEVQVNVQLVDAETGAQLWGERLDYGQADHPGAQDRIVARIARALGIELVEAESRRSLRERPTNPDAADLAMRGRAISNRPVTRERTEQARQLFEAALALDGDSVPALLGLAGAHLSLVLNQWRDNNERRPLLERAEAAVARAIVLAPGSAPAHAVRGRVLRARGEPEQAVAAFERSIELNSNDAGVHADLGRVKMDVGLAAETIGEIEQAVRLSPRDRRSYLWFFWAGLSALYTGDDEAAARWLRRAIEANPGYENPRGFLPIAYAGLGREDEARELMREFLHQRPDLRMSNWDRAYERRHPVVVAQRERIYDTLRRLGVPE